MADTEDKPTDLPGLAGLGVWAGFAGLLALFMRGDMTEVLSLSADMAWVGDVALLFAFFVVGIYIPAKMYRQR